MCTCFAAFKNEPIYAMNFDCWDIPSRIRIDEHDGISTFYFEVSLGGNFLETAALNGHGFFGNFQGNLSDRHQNIAPGPNCISIDHLYRRSLQSAQSIDDFYQILDGKTVVYNPIPPEYNKLHNLFADRNGKALILETSCGENDITPIRGDYLAMTNFPAGQFKDVDYRSVSGAGSDRYVRVCEYLGQHAEIDVKRAFDVLASVVQKEEHWETLTSMVFVPNEMAVYLSLKRSFDQVWRVDVPGKTIERLWGSQPPVRMKIPAAGQDLKELETAA